MNNIQKELNNKLNDLENIINKIDNINNVNEFNEIYVKIKSYENNILKIHSTVKKMLILKDNLNVILNNYILKKQNTKKIEKIHENNIFVSNRNVTNEESYNDKNFTKFSVINISNKNLDIIENSPIYYIQETKQYCIKINDNLIMGNIGNIYNMSTTNTAEKIKKCKYNNCDGLFYEKKCQYYHDDEQRNFTNYSWNHILNDKHGKIKNKNNYMNIQKYDLYNTRFIGSLETLKEDLPFSSIYEKTLRNNQLMHDILIYLILSKYLSH